MPILVREPKIRFIAPSEKIHKQYLCILIIHGPYSIEDAVKVLNKRFEETVTWWDREFDEKLTQEEWELMQRSDDRELRWVQGLKGNDRHVRTVLEHATRILA